MFIKSVSSNVKDVFIGHGWQSWVRIDMDAKRIIKSNCTIKPQLFQTILGKFTSDYRRMKWNIFNKMRMS